MLHLKFESGVQQVYKEDNIPKDAPLKRLQYILRTIKENVKVTSLEIAKHLKVSDKKIKRDLAKLKAECKIERMGGLKLGFWKVNEITTGLPPTLW